VILCLCQSVTDHEVDAVIRRGAHSVAAVSRACGAGSDCGCCNRMIERRIEQACGADCADCPRRRPELASAAAV
jgi:bacterioferritin-associated ferredoxin